MSSSVISISEVVSTNILGVTQTIEHQHFGSLIDNTLVSKYQADKSVQMGLMSSSLIGDLVWEWWKTGLRSQQRLSVTIKTVDAWVSAMQQIFYNTDDRSPAGSAPLYIPTEVQFVTTNSSKEQETRTTVKVAVRDHGADTASYPAAYQEGGSVWNIHKDYSAMTAGQAAANRGF